MSLLALALSTSAALAETLKDPSGPSPLEAPALAEAHRRRSITFTWMGRVALIGGEVGLVLLYRNLQPTLLEKGFWGYALPAISTACVFWSTAEATLALKALDRAPARPWIAGLGVGAMVLGYPLALWAGLSGRSRELQYTILAVTQVAGIGGIQLQGLAYRIQGKQAPAEQAARVWLQPLLVPLDRGLMVGAALRI